MATIINNPPRKQAPADSGTGGFMLDLIVLLIVLAVLLFAFYGIPALRRSSTSTQNGASNNQNINLPAPGNNSGSTGTNTGGGGTIY
jgi:hypothetical protein